MTALERRIEDLARRPHVRDIIVRRFVSGSWQVIVYRDRPVHSTSANRATLPEALAEVEALLEDAEAAA